MPKKKKEHVHNWYAYNVSCPHCDHAVEECLRRDNGKECNAMRIVDPSGDEVRRWGA